MEIVSRTTSTTLKKDYELQRQKESRKKYKKYKNLNTILESVHTIVIIGATSTSVGLAIFRVGLIVAPISAGMACSLSLANEILHKVLLNKYNKYRKQY